MGFNSYFWTGNKKNLLFKFLWTWVWIFRRLHIQLFPFQTRIKGFSVYSTVHFVQWRLNLIFVVKRIMVSSFCSIWRPIGSVPVFVGVRYGAWMQILACWVASLTPSHGVTCNNQLINVARNQLINTWPTISWSTRGQQSADPTCCQ